MQEKLIAVCGTTGVGKTKLAIHIAKTVAAASQRSHNGLPNRYSAACLNGDSMQVYKGLDIVTNKPSLEEKSACDHDLFDFVNVSTRSKDVCTLQHRSSFFPAIYFTFCNCNYSQKKSIVWENSGETHWLASRSCMAKTLFQSWSVAPITTSNLYFGRAIC